jgi:glycerol uptake operon antiterminator
MSLAFLSDGHLINISGFISTPVCWHSQGIMLKGNKQPYPVPSVAHWFDRPVIPVFSELGEMESSMLPHASLGFLQGGELSDLPRAVELLSQGTLVNLPIILHIDLLAGLSSDEAGLRYLAGLKRINGIITVRSHLVAAARRLGLASVLLVFLQDGRAVERGLHVIEQCKPDAVELVPGVAALQTASQFERISIPRIGGGLIRSPALVKQLLASGCRAVSSSNSDLWKMNVAA